MSIYKATVPAEEEEEEKGLTRRPQPKALPLLLLLPLAPSDTTSSSPVRLRPHRLARRVLALPSEEVEDERERLGRRPKDLMASRAFSPKVGLRAGVRAAEAAMASSSSCFLIASHCAMASSSSRLRHSSHRALMNSCIESGGGVAVAGVAGVVGVA